MPDRPTLAWYAVHAAERAAHYEAADVRGLHARMLAACPAGGRALDVGCGSGRDVAFLRREGREASGVDASAEMLAEARRRHPEVAAHLRKDRLPALATLGAERFDLVTATAVLMHLSAADLGPAVRRLLALLRSGGTLLLSVPELADTTAERDDLGRLFRPDTAATIRKIAEAAGARCLVDETDGDIPDRRHAWRLLAFRAG